MPKQKWAMEKNGKTGKRKQASTAARRVLTTQDWDAEAHMQDRQHERSERLSAEAQELLPWTPGRAKRHTLSYVGEGSLAGGAALARENRRTTHWSADRRAQEALSGANSTSARSRQRLRKSRGCPHEQVSRRRKSGATGRAARFLTRSRRSWRRFSSRDRWKRRSRR